MKPLALSCDWGIISFVTKMLLEGVDSITKSFKYSILKYRNIDEEPNLTTYIIDFTVANDLLSVPEIS